MDQSEGRILYHVTSFTARVFLEVWDRVLGDWVRSAKHENEATGSDVIKKTRKSTTDHVIEPKTHFFIQDLAIILHCSCLHHPVGR